MRTEVLDDMMPEQDISLMRRVETLENWRAMQDVSFAVHGENLKHMDKRFDAIEKKLEESQAWIKRALTVVGVLIVTAFVQFVLRGGLA